LIVVIIMHASSSWKQDKGATLFKMKVFLPKVPTNAGPHNDAKRASAAIMTDGQGQVSKRKRHRYKKMLKKKLRHIHCGGKSDEDFKGKFCEDPQGKHAERVPRSKRFSLDDMKISVRSSWDDMEMGVYLVGTDNNDEEVLLAVLLPRREANKMKKQRSIFRKALDAIVNTKNDVSRGGDNEGKSKCYKLFGFRKQPLGKDVGEYAFKSDVALEDMQFARKEVANYVSLLEELAKPYLSPQDRSGFSKMKATMGLPATSQEDDGFATQFAVALDYWSPQHIDEDFFWTILSVLDKNMSCSKEKILHWFVFPEFNLRVPLCSGDILIFNPLVTHGCSNQTEDDTFIFSAYVSSKTVAACGSNSM
jgi:hypothetical protein